MGPGKFACDRQIFQFPGGSAHLFSYQCSWILSSNPAEEILGLLPTLSQIGAPKLPLPVFPGVRAAGRRSVAKRGQASSGIYRSLSTRGLAWDKWVE
jgi:hypothetical protein